MKTIRVERPARCLLIVAAVFILVTCAARQTCAQWTAGDAQRAYTAYNNAFLRTESDGYSKYFATVQGGSAHEGFWTFANEIQMAEDAYYENETTANQNEVQSLCDGFIYQHGDTWTSDTFDDDLLWAVIAFARAYQVTGTSRWLTNAENNFNDVYNRGLLSDGAIVWNSKGCTGHPITGGCQDSMSGSQPDWDFVIAGRIIYNITGTTSYKTEADSVYTWSKANLYDSSTGQIYNNPPQVVGQYTYNYGVAIGAANEEGDTALIANAASYVFNGFTPNGSQPVYDGTYNGYNILPDYGQGDLNDSGFNGILCRWLGIANGHGSISTAVLDAWQANTNAAWANRNGTTELIWNAWGTDSEDKTPSTGTYGWDDSSAVSCLVDTPPTA